jgi:hypothetical protein
MTLIWYSSKPLPCRTYFNFMVDISLAAKLDKKYTAHCLRATAIQHMNDAGFEARHIMFMSGHKSEASIRSYNRSCSNRQKRQISPPSQELFLKENKLRQIYRLLSLQIPPSHQTISKLVRKSWIWYPPSSLHSPTIRISRLSHSFLVLRLQGAQYIYKDCNWQCSNIRCSKQLVNIVLLLFFFNGQ